NIYKSRHLVENLFARLKHFRSISTRFDKLARHFKAMIYIACAMIWVNSE
ncbi:MAG: transposase, partial [Endozoicomonadaceae bacterium]|nr:transposase [Endozoicomonadaceae bacterium]